MGKFILLLASIISFSSLSQVENISDSIIFKTRCDCLEAEYNFKKEFLGNLMNSNEDFILNPQFVEKHHLTTEKLNAINTRCEKYPDTETADTCPYERQLDDINLDYELVLRVIQMKPIQHHDIDESGKE